MMNRNVITLEDPIENESEQVLQVQINEKAGITYSVGLKAVLRHDPDVIMVGEIRDAETAEIAVRAAMTGHLILTTMHTRDAKGAIYRLLEFGISWIEIQQTLLAVTAQRLLELQCPICERKDCNGGCGVKKRRKRGRMIAIVGIAIFMIIYFAIPSFKEGLNHAFSTISKLDTAIVIEYLRSYGKLAAVVSFILMVLQSIAAPIPAFLITLSNAAIFGWWQGAILSWASAMAGAALCFFIARVLGRDVVEKLTSKGAMESVDVFFEKYGNRTIMVCRLLPFVSFDFVSYAAGLTNMKFWSFFIATGIGQLPATIVYSYVGGTLTGGAQKLFVGLLTLFAISILIGVAKRVYSDKQKGKVKEEVVK